MKILTLDIETSPHVAYSFGVWQTNLLPAHLIEPGRVLTWAAKWLDKKSVSYKTYTDDDFLTALHQMLCAADIVVGYNHDKFDLRHLNREFVEYGLHPPRPCATIDMLKVVKRRFNFPHNRLDYVAQRILLESKLDTGGFELWPAFMSGEPKAERLMKRYNIQDVVLTEKLYAYLRPWIPNHPFGGGDIKIDDAEVVYACPACESTKISRERPRRTRCFAIRVNQCLSCGAWSEGRRTKI